MRVLIAYRSRYGTTASCARALASLLRSPSEIVDLGRTRAIDLQPFDVVVIGGSIYGGKILRQVPAFCERNREALLDKRIGVFICCLYQGEHARMQLRAAFPGWVLERSFAHALAGGELVHSKLTLIDRLLVQRLPQGRRDILRLNPEALQALADAVNALAAT